MFFKTTLSLATILYFFVSPSSFANEGDSQFSKDLLYFLNDTTAPNLLTLDQSVPLSASTKAQPWSGFYWPLDMGSVANRYLDGMSVFRLAMSPEARNEHYLSRLNELQNRSQAIDASTLDRLSPAEKYDLYLGDRDFTFTHSVIQSLQEQLGRLHHFSRWEGSCHGWATAAAFSPRPSHAITLPSLDAKYLITFYPDDLKALSTLLWANSLIQDFTRVSGILCKDKSPEIDSKTGKVLDKACAGVNPGILHLSLLEITGQKSESFIMNRTNNTQVWNQPISGYSMKYFNRNNSEEGSLNNSITPYDPANDQFGSAFRAAGTQSIVGVNLSIQYTKENRPTHRTVDSKHNDSTRTLEVRYDLELDQNKQVIGGEWLSASSDDEDSGTMPVYPGFIWRFQGENPMAMSIVDKDIPAPTSSDYLSPRLVDLSKIASQFRYKHFHYAKDGTSSVFYEELKPQPLGAVVRELVRLSNEN